MKKVSIVCLIITATMFSYAADKADEDLATIITQQGTFKRPVYKSSQKEINIADQAFDGAIASTEEFQYIVNIQKRVPDLLPYPIMVYDTDKVSPTQSHACGACFSIKSNPETKTTELLVISLPLQRFSGDEKKFFIGHELGHCIKKYCGSMEAQTKHLIHKELFNEAYQAQYEAIVSGFFNTVQAYLFSYFPLTIFSGPATICIYYFALRGAYNFGISKRDAHLVAQACPHEEEFGCDSFAVETGTTPDEKIKIAQGGIKFLSPFDTIIERIACNIVYFDHPPHGTRIEKLRQHIAAQHKLLTNTII